ncbi:SgcJ/EcaC family oxidoreductase [Streptomyces sp. NPDC048637]|uniref:SgcJ/EcaC family oxidoreductase n=1 Tax=Streptomyces sp. NPDC048637 TaxID=3155636 RepID=UPI003420EB8E
MSGRGEATFCCPVALRLSDSQLCFGRRLFGRETFTSAMAEALSSPLKDIRTSLEADDIRFTTPDVAIVSRTETVHDERSEAEGSSELPLVGAMTYVLTRQGDDWRIALAQTTPVR